MKIKPDLNEMKKIREEILRDDGCSVGLHWIIRIIEKWEQRREQFDYPSDEQIKRIIEYSPSFLERFFSCLEEDFRKDIVQYVIRAWAEMENEE